MAKIKTKALFWETSTNREKDQPKFTLKREDHEVNGVVYRSAYQVFMDATTEYEAATEIAGSWYAWEHLSEIEWFKTGKKGNSAMNAHIGLVEWRRHKSLKELDEQISNLKKKAKSGDVSASKAVIAHLKEQEKIRNKPPEKELKKNSTSNMVADFMKAQNKKKEANRK